MGHVRPLPSPVSSSAATRFFLAYYQWNLTVRSRSHARNVTTSQSAFRPHTHPLRHFIRPLHISPNPKLCKRRTYSSSISSWLRQPHAHLYSMLSTTAAVRIPSFTRNVSCTASRVSSNSEAYADAEEQSADTKHRSQEHTRSSNISQARDLSYPLRQLMRQVPYPVVVITSSLPASLSPSSSSMQHIGEISPLMHSPESYFRGMTISSLTTVTLSPVPHITFNIKLPSSTYTAMQASGYFLAHIMASTPAGVRVANVFARGGGGGAAASAVQGRETNPFWKLVSDLGLASGGRGGKQEINDGIKIYIDSHSNSSPLIAGSSSSLTNNPTLSVLRCKLLTGPKSSIHVGDHIVVVGEVIGILDLRQDGGGAGGRRGQDGEEAEEMGLLYVNGGYRHIGSAMFSDPQQHGKRDTERVLPYGIRQAQMARVKEGDVVHRTLGLNVRRGDEGMEGDRQE